MIKANYLVLCENVLKDSQGRVSLINIFDVIGSEKLPAIAEKFSIAFSVTPEKKDVKDGKFKIKLIIRSVKAKKEVFKIEGEGFVDNVKGNIVSHVDLGARLPLENKGAHNLLLFINNEFITETKFEVREGKPDEQ